MKHGASLGLFVLRVSVAVIFISSGWQKLDGGMEGFTGAVAGLGFPAAAFFAYAAALVEFVGGIAILLGIGTRVFAGLIAIVMLVAFFGAHDGSLTAGRMAFALLGSSIALACIGAGSWAIGCPMCRAGKSDWCCGLTACSDKGCGGNCGCKEGKK